MDLKKIVSVVAAFFLVILLGFCWFINRQEQQEDKKYNEWEALRRATEVECRDLEKQIEELEQKYQEATEQKATTQVLFTDLNEQIYTECLPQLEEQGFSGTLTVSSKQLPGNEGCLTVKQYKELIDKGWDVCVRWESPTNVNQWWNSLKKELAEREISINGGIYFPLGTYSNSVDRRLRQMGFQVVIVERNDTESPLQNQYEEDLWHINAMGCMTKQPKKWLKQAVTEKANVIFSVNFENEKQKYSESSFLRMLNVFKEYDLKKELLVCNIQVARKHYEACVKGVSPQTEAKYQEQKQLLEKKLDQTRKKLDKINAEYQ